MKTSLILLPGLLCDQQLWAAQITRLSDLADCQTVNLAPYSSIQKMADAVLDQAPPVFHLSGFSMGGFVAMEIVARAPKRVSGLALLSTCAHGISPAVRQNYLDSIALIKAGHFDNYLSNAFPRYVASERIHDKDLWLIYSKMAKHLGPAVAITQMQALLEYPGFLGDLGEIACPSTIICGQEDQRASFAVYQELATSIPKASLNVIKLSGHFTPIEKPLEVTDCLERWLKVDGK